MKVRTIVASIAAFGSFGAFVVIGAAIALILVYRHSVQNFQPSLPATDVETTLSQSSIQ